jgi:hypothetical protein
MSRDHELLLFDGAEALIDELATAGHMLAVATGKTRKGLDRAFEVSGLGTRFHASRCADECHSKPHPQMLEELMDEFGVGPEATLMIGDTTHDLLMASNAPGSLHWEWPTARIRGKPWRSKLLCTVRGNVAELANGCGDTLEAASGLCQRRTGEGGAVCASRWIDPEAANPAFVVRFRGRAHAYLNRCGHVSGRTGLATGRVLRYFRLILDLRHARRALCAGFGALSGRALQRQGAGGAGGGRG